VNSVKPINSGEEFSFKDIDSDIPSTAGSDSLQEQESLDDDSHHSGPNSTHDTHHLFVTIDSPMTRNGQTYIKVCKLCL
jgi:hypothetical protein